MAGRFTASGGTSPPGARLGSGRQHRNQRQFHRDLYPGRQRPRRVTLSTAANSNLVVWMVSPYRGLFLVNDPNTVQEEASTCSRSRRFRIPR